MPESKGMHLTSENREVIAEGIYVPESAGKIARKINVSASTVTREVKKNRTIKEKATRGKKSTRCVHYRDCQQSGTACSKCLTYYTTCKHCKTHDCTHTCPNYERRMCPLTSKWPYVCLPTCPKRGTCTFPKCSYSAIEADSAYRQRLSEARSGIDITEEQLSAMDALVTPLIKQGQSFEAIWITHGDELPICTRSAYNYQQLGLFSTTNLDLPRVVRLKPRTKTCASPSRNRVDRTGRTYDDFLALPLADQARVVQGDSVVGFEDNKFDILTLHFVSVCTQLYLLKHHQDSDAVVAHFNNIERILGSPEAFEALMGILLVDRGVEFDDWAGIEQSCLDASAKRCRVFYCDAMKSNQKSQAERNHEQLRRILPKGRSDFDKLTERDVSLCTSNVNSYVGSGRGNKCPLELAGGLIPEELLTALGIEYLDPDDVVLTPALLPHVVQQ